MQKFLTVPHGRMAVYPKFGLRMFQPVYFYIEDNVSLSLYDFAKSVLTLCMENNIIVNFDGRIIFFSVYS